MTLSRASADYIARKAKRGRRSVIREERVGPTPETAAKLLPDPLALMLRHELIDAEAVSGALEIRSVYMAIVGQLMPKARGESAGGRSEISARLAWIHSHRYKPWADRWAGETLAATLDMILEGAMHVSFRERIANSLKDYADIRRLYPVPHDLGE